MDTRSVGDVSGVVFPDLVMTRALNCLPGDIHGSPIPYCFPARYLGILLSVRWMGIGLWQLGVTRPKW